MYRRKIVFRAWDKDKKQFIGFYGNGLHMWENGQIYADGMNVTDRIELHQYTDVYDDADDYVKICEDDIVELQYEGKTYICFVKYEVGGFMFASGEFPDSYVWFSELIESDGDSCYIPDCKVIGNTKENPELIA